VIRACACKRLIVCLVVQNRTTSCNAFIRFTDSDSLSSSDNSINIQLKGEFTQTSKLAHDLLTLNLRVYDTLP